MQQAKLTASHLEPVYRMKEESRLKAAPHFQLRIV
jgi:hypothetical protein